MIIVILGGIKIPSVPPAQIVPAASSGEYPLFLISGIPIFPIAAQVAGEDPHKAAKIEQAPRFDITSPPGTLFSQRSRAEYKSLPAGDAATAIPISKNIGIVTIPKSCNPFQNVSAKRGTLPNPSMAKKKTVETKAKPNAIGIPVASTAKVATTIHKARVKGSILVFFLSFVFINY